MADSGRSLPPPLSLGHHRGGQVAMTSLTRKATVNANSDPILFKTQHLFP